MTSPSPSTVRETSAPRMSFPARLLGVIVSPGSAFRDIARRPGFLYPLLASIIASVAVSETLLAKVGMERMLRIAMEQGGQASGASSEQARQGLEQAAKFGAFFAHLGGVLGPPIYLLVIAAIGLAITNLIFGATVDFAKVFSVTCYANLVSLLGALMALGVILWGDPEHLSFQNLIPSNPGFFLNPFETSKPLYALAGSLDVFTFWFLALQAIGLSEATGRRIKPLAVFLTYLGFWLIWVLGKVGLAMLM